MDILVIMISLSLSLQKRACNMNFLFLSFLQGKQCHLTGINKENNKIILTNIYFRVAVEIALNTRPHILYHFITVAAINSSDFIM